jgi:large subunit ribosomal protein L31
MKTGIHPEYVTAQVTCACGNTFTTRSTRPVLKLEICSACHPFYTGRQKLMDTAGRVERFQKRFAKTGGAMAKPTAKKLDAKPAAPRMKVLTTSPKAKAPAPGSAPKNPQGAKKEKPKAEKPAKP